MSASSLLDLLKSLFAFNRPWSYLRPLTQALRTRPYDLAALAALDDDLTRNHREMPLSLLWRIGRLAEKAQTKPGDAAANRIIDVIVRSVTWEVQIRSMGV